MTNPTPHGQVPAIQRYKIGYHSDEWGVRSLSPTSIYDDAGPWVRYEDHAAVITALRTQQPAPAGATEEVENLRKALVYAAFALHDTPQYMLAQGITLIDGDTVRVSRDGWTVEASVNPHRQPAPATPITVEQVEDAIGLQSSAWDTIGAEKIVEAVLRLANAAPATQQAGERVYAFRRKGLADFCTCDEARYEELSNKPHLFETRIFYTAPR